MLIVHAVSFISVSYFDQNAILFYFLLASIATLSVLPVTAMQRTEAYPASHAAVMTSPLFPQIPIFHTRDEQSYTVRCRFSDEKRGEICHQYAGVDDFANPASAGMGNRQ